MNSNVDSTALRQQALQQQLQPWPSTQITSFDADTVVLTIADRTEMAAVATWLRDHKQWQCTMPIDCTVIDRLHLQQTPRFVVIWQVYSLSLGLRVQLRTWVDSDHPEVDSLVSIWPGMNWHEREAWDLYGIQFRHHPYLKRVLMYEEFIGHPLRKDYPVDKRQPLVPMRDPHEVSTQRYPAKEQLNPP